MFRDLSTNLLSSTILKCRAPFARWTSVKMEPVKHFLKWDRFEEKIRKSFKGYRNEKKLFDVTLATDDGFQIEAHRIILSAGSEFFSDIFTKCNQTNMLVYLKGIARKELEQITDFLYDGETSIAKQELEAFLKTAMELKLEGLPPKEDDIIPPHDQSVKIFKKNSSNKTNQVLPTSSKLQSKKVHNDEVVFVDVDEDDKEAIDTLDMNLDLDEQLDQIEEDDPGIWKCNTCGETGIPAENVKKHAEYHIQSNNSDLEEKMDQLIERCRGIWKCKTCDRTALRKDHIRQHVETHIKGVIHSCKICKKHFSTRHTLLSHMYNLHPSRLYSCNVCGRINMNRMNLQKHKLKCEGTPKEQRKTQ